MIRRSRAQSEVVGVILLTAVIVVLVTVAGGIFLSEMLDTDDDPLISAESNVTATNVWLSHTGGDSVAAADVEVIVRSSGTTTRTPLSSFDSAPGDQFEPGTEWETAVNLTDGEAQLLVVHRPSNTVVHEAEYRVDRDQPSFDVTVTNAPGTVSAGEDATVTAIVENTGDFEETQPVTFSVDGTEIDRRNLTLSGGEQRAKTFSYSTDSTDVPEITATVESQDDSDSRSVSVGEPATFAVSITDAPDSVTTGDRVSVEAAVTNTGDIADTQFVTFAVDGTEVGNQSVTLSGGTEKKVTFDYDTDDSDPPEIDATVESTDESDSRTVTVSRPAFFDVNITTDDAVVVGDDLVVDAKIDNTGDLETTQTVAFSVNGSTITDRTVTLSGGETATEKFTYTTDGDDQPELTAAVASENESDSSVVRVDQPSSFVVTITEYDDPVVAGENVDVTATINNTGDVADTQTLNFSMNGSTIAQRTVSLAGGEGTTATFTSPTDADNVPEISVDVASEDDSDSRTVTVLEPASFGVQIVDTNSPVDEGETLEVTVEVANTGEATDTQTILIQSDIGSDQTAVSLDGGETTTVVLTIQTEDGDVGVYTVTASSDDDSDSEFVRVQEGGGIPGFSFTIGVLAILLATLLFRLRDRDHGGGDQ